MIAGRIRMLATAASLAALTVGLAGCGDPEQEAAGAQAPGGAATATAGDPTVPPVDTTAPPSSTTAAPATSTVSVVPAIDAECTVDRKTLEVAVEAYYAGTGALPADEATLVTEEYLRAEVPTYDLVPGTGEVVRTAGVQCDEDDRATGETAADTGVAAEPMTADEFYADLSPETIELFGGEACARELSEIAAAAMRFEAREGREPDDLDELAGDLPTAPVLWAFDADREELVPAPGSPCPDLASATEQDPTDACEAGRKTLEVAREAYLAMMGEGTEPTEADLVSAGLLREELDDWDLAGGVPVPQPGSPCG